MGGRPAAMAGEMCTNTDFSESLFGEVKSHYHVLACPHAGRKENK